MTIEEYRNLASEGKLSRKMRRSLVIRIRHKYNFIERIQNEIKEIDDILYANLLVKNKDKEYINSDVIIEHQEDLILMEND